MKYCHFRSKHKSHIPLYLPNKTARYRYNNKLYYSLLDVLGRNFSNNPAIYVCRTPGRPFSH